MSIAKGLAGSTRDYGHGPCESKRFLKRLAHRLFRKTAKGVIAEQLEELKESPEEIDNSLNESSEQSLSYDYDDYYNDRFWFAEDEYDDYYDRFRDALDVPWKR